MIADDYGEKIQDLPFLNQLVDKTFFLIEKAGWEKFQLSDLLDLKNEEGEDLFSFTDLSSVLSSKEDFISLFQYWLTSRLRQEKFDFTEQDDQKEKIFEILMRRFDVMASYQKAIFSIQAFYFSSPLFMIAGFCVLKECVRDVFLLADIDLDTVDQWAFSVSYAKLIHTWSEDCTPDLAVTMAELDRLLETFFDS